MAYNLHLPMSKTLSPIRIAFTLSPLAILFLLVEWVSLSLSSVFSCVEVVALGVQVFDEIPEPFANQLHLELLTPPFFGEREVEIIRRLISTLPVLQRKKDW
jgi:hypothetical protein